MTIFFILMFLMLSYVLASKIKEETKTSFLIVFSVLSFLVILFSIL